MQIIRHCAKLVFSSLIFGATALLSSAGAAEYKVGVFLSYTGPFANLGKDTTQGMELFFAQAAASGKDKFILVKEDDESKADVALTKVRKLVERDRVDVLVGSVASQVNLAVQDYARKQQVPVVIPISSSRDLTSRARFNEWQFRISEQSDQPNFPFGAWV